MTRVVRLAPTDRNEHFFLSVNNIIIHMKWYQNDYVKLATIIVGSIVAFTLLSKYQIISSEGYDAMASIMPTVTSKVAPAVVPTYGVNAPVGLTTQTGVMPTSAPPYAPVQPMQAISPLTSVVDPVPVDDGMGVKGYASSYADRPKDCFPKDQLNAEELLPKDPYSQWAAVNPDGQGALADRNFLSAGYHIGIDTQGSSLRNASYDLRPAPPNPMVKVSPWANSTITPQENVKTWDIV